MTAPRTSQTISTRLSAPILVALAIAGAVLGLISSLTRWPTEFATMYAAARAVGDDSAANVYDYATLAHLNAAHHYVSGAILPFTDPPFALLALRPLAALPFVAAQIIWTVIIYAALLGAALLLAWPFAVFIERSDTAGDHVASRRFPALAFAIGAAVLVLMFPPTDAPYWGRLAAVTIFLLTLGLSARAHGRPIVAGIALGLATGFAGWGAIGLPVIVGILVLGLMLWEQWQTTLAGVLTVVVVNALPKAIFPASGAGAFQAQQAFLQGVYATDQHNTSVQGLIANMLVITEHTGTLTFRQGERLAHALGIGVVVLAIALALIAAGVRILRRRTGRDAKYVGALWPALAALIATESLSGPVVWPAEALVVPLAGLVLLAYAALIPPDRIRWRAAMMLLALLGVLLGIAAALGGVAWRDLPQGEPVRALYVLPALAALAIYAAALVGLAGITLNAIRVPSSARATGELVPAVVRAGPSR